MLDQIQVPKSGKIIIWVDDKPRHNLKWVYQLEKAGISVILCKSTNEALSLIKSYKWTLLLKNSSIRIVTDMKRYNNDTAGIDLIDKLRQDYHFDHDVLIFTGRGHEKHTREHCIDYDVTRNVYVTSKSSVVKQYIFSKY